MEARLDGGALATVAGSHPYALDSHIGLELAPESSEQPGVPLPADDLRDLRLALPAGLLLNPAVVPRCELSQFNTPRLSEGSRSGESCPDKSQVGTVDVHTGLESGTVRRFGVFSITPPPGFPAAIGFAPYGVPVVFALRLNADADGGYAFSLEAVNIQQSFGVNALDISLWGTPWAVSHNGERGNCLNEEEPLFPWGKCSVGFPFNNRPIPFLTLPPDCTAPMAFTATARFWHAEAPATRTYTEIAEGDPLRLEGCGGLRFGPQPVAQLTNRKASSPSGFVFRIEDSNPGLTSRSERMGSNTRRAVISLPEGVTVNPAVGVGLGVCSPAQYASELVSTPRGTGCPPASEIGEFTLRTPLLEERLQGAAYLAEPDDPATPAAGAENPSDSLLALYLVAKNPQRGVLVKLAGRLTAAPDDGRLTAVFDGLPQLPYSDLEVSFSTTNRSLLSTPSDCGPASTRVELTPWAAGVQPLAIGSPSVIDAGVGGGPCPGDGPPPFEPGILAGSVNPNVGSYTPFYIHLTRTDGEQEITSYSAVLPKGVTGKLAGVAVCSDEAIASARLRTGREEEASPSCPAASQVGRTLSGYGVGAVLAFAPGRVYLAGPYRGAPLSLVTINSATIGPFDLGTIVIRSAFQVDPRTAQLKIDAGTSDPIPHIRSGIPLRLRDVRIFVDRPNFARNPTSCSPSRVDSTLTGAGTRFDDPSDDSSASVSAYFQLLNCRDLGFRPRLGLRLLGGTKRGDYPALRATFAARRRNANLKRIAVTMPRSEFLAVSHIRSICTRADYAAESCPDSSAYGRAVAHTPLFDEPLRGPVFLRASPRRLPDLVASLRSGSIQIELVGRIEPSDKGMRVLFTDLPDAELRRFVMRLNGGRRGLLVNSVDICRTKPRAIVKALGQNDKGVVLSPRLRGRCPEKGRG